MLCPKCNASVLDNARFCGSCGQAIGAGGNDAQATQIRPPRTPAGAGAAPSAGGTDAWTTATSQLPGLIERIKKILLTPKTEWPIIEAEPTSVAQLYTGYAMPLVGFAALMSFLRMSVIGISLPLIGTIRAPLLSGLVSAVVGFAFGLLFLFLFGWIIKTLAPTFSGQGDQRQALKTAAYAATPAWIGSVFGLLPGVGGLLRLAAGIYAIYLLYLGLPPLMRSPPEKAVGYTAATIGCGILLGIAFAVVGYVTGGFGGLGGLGGYGRYGGMHTLGMTREAQQQQAAAAVGALIGGALGTDQKGKDGLSAAINGLAEAGQKIEQQQKYAANSGAQGNAAANSATGAADPAANAQNAAAAAAGLLTALGGAMGGNRRVDPVDFHTLKQMLPDSLPGMQRTAAEGSSQQALGVKGSSATANYQGPAGARAEIKIADVSAVSGLLNAAGSLAQNTTSESDTGYEKNTTIGGRSVHEKYDSNSRHGELSAIVAQRFAVDVTGDGVDMSTLETYVTYVDFARLEALKDAGARAN
jgi:hypothetical protein